MKRITKLPPNHIFVFGSNLAGIHGKGAAKDAVKYFGAQRGIGAGLCGRSYAIPTKNHHADDKGMDLDDMSFYIDMFLACAKRHPELTFIVTPIGCGLAGYKPSDIAPLFHISLPNVILPEEFKDETLQH